MRALFWLSVAFNAYMFVAIIYWIVQWQPHRVVEAIVIFLIGGAINRFLGKRAYPDAYAQMQAEKAQKAP